MHTAQATETLQLVQTLIAQQIVDGVQDRPCMRFDGDLVLRAQGAEIKGRHDRRHGRAAGLMAADLHAVALGPDVVGIVDGPG